jgi:hypothetical protein
MGLSAFNYDKALEVVKDNPFGKNFLERNKARLTELGTEAGQQVLQEIVALFAAGRNREAWQAFYGNATSWATLAQGAAEDAENTAAMAQRWNDLGTFLQECGVAAAKALLAILVAGFLA